MGLMQRGFTKEELLNQFLGQDTGQEVAVPAEGTEKTITMIGIIGEVEVGVMTDMNMIDILGKKKTIRTEAGAVVLALTILRAEEEASMMVIRVVDQWVLLLLVAAPLLGKVLPHARHHSLRVKALIDAAVMDILQVLEVFHREAVLLILGVHPLETQILMNDLMDGMGITGVFK